MPAAQIILCSAVSSRDAELKLLFLKGQIKAKDIFIDFDHVRPGDFKISNEISI